MEREKDKVSADLGSQELEVPIPAVLGLQGMWLERHLGWPLPFVTLEETKEHLRILRECRWEIRRTVRVIRSGSGEIRVHLSPYGLCVTRVSLISTFPIGSC